MDLGIGADVSGAARERAVRLARSLCADAGLYGGHACLSCQTVAWQVVARAGVDVLETRLPPAPHGGSDRTARVHRARVLAAIDTGLVSTGSAGPSSKRAEGR